MSVVWPQRDRHGRPDRLGWTRTGYKLFEIPAPHVRLYSRPGAYRREVGVSMLQFPGNQHWYVDVVEVANKVWHPSDGEPGWTAPSDDPRTEAGQGREFHGRFATRQAALRFVEKVWRKNFSPRTHVLMDKDHSRPWRPKKVECARCGKPADRPVRDVKRNKTRWVCNRHWFWWWEKGINQ